MAADYCKVLGLIDSVDLTLLVTSELVTNAVKHGNKQEDIPVTNVWSSPARTSLELALSRLGSLSAPAREETPRHVRGTHDILSLQYWAPHAVPDVLQTGEYAHLVYGLQVPEPSRQELDRALQVLCDRQDLLTVEPAVELAFVLDERVLHRVVAGDVRIMCKQLDYLLSCATNLPKVSVQLLPLATHHLPGPVQPSVLVDGTAERLVLLEGHNAPEVVRQRESVAVFVQYFSALRAHALSPEQSRERIQQIHDDLAKQPSAT